MAQQRPANCRHPGAGHRHGDRIGAGRFDRSVSIWISTNVPLRCQVGGAFARVAPLATTGLTPPVAPSAPAALALLLPWRRWAPLGALALGGWIGTDLLLHLGQGALGNLLEVGLAGGAVLWWRTRAGRRPAGLPPTNLNGWLERCEGLIEQFSKLACSSPTELGQRQSQLAHLRLELQVSTLQLAVVGTEALAPAWHPRLAQGLQGRQALKLQWGHPLPSGQAGWRWPKALGSCDVLLYHLQLPLKACDLRWLEARPEGQPAWVLAQLSQGSDPSQQREQLEAQIQSVPAAQLLLWSGKPEDFGASLEPLTIALSSQGARLRLNGQTRTAMHLHQAWLVELEQVRRQHWLALQQRTQWVVAAGVVAAPLPSLDLLVLGVANGLMLQEMARLWDCPWSLDQLQAAAGELAKAALALGVVEWSGQALASMIKWHAPTWLLGSALQALSAAYLTRVVGHAMADLLALSAGLSEPNLELIKQRAPLLVAQAAEDARLDWPRFLEQGQNWLQQMTPSQPQPAG